ncbi:Glucan endo-1,3-beta-glucosidase [Capsicum annuum]|uniref:Glucan endo-1,3-beta-glucosidase n=1 Tax=Capsicum annuum TaxID=4072 RepID=A0A1U8FGD7_CAPAN|nr:Glucan endo-1,3-beta-glucosidase [Capsicum annuum]PHT93863.1 Glucan endo-1,3-beta-glucosidase [Capsicum annuum]
MGFLSFPAATLLLVGLLIQMIGAQSVGVCYGKIANNLPSEQDVIKLYNANGIKKMRIYFPDVKVFSALKGSNIEIILDVPNQDLEALTNPSTANGWVQDNIQRHFPDVKFKYIAVGNEVDPGTETAQYVRFVSQAMENVYNALSATGLQDQIKVSTATYSGLLTNTYPPRDSIFREEYKSFINPIIGFLARNNLPLLANIYPYFGHTEDSNVPLSYALFNQQEKNSAGYQNLFDALLDSMYYATEKLGGQNIEIIVSESGWPSSGHPAATIENAQTYYSNLINHIKGGAGTLKKPGRMIETYLFAMFDENQKMGKPSEQHFGLFNPDQRPKYQLNFN